MDGMPATFADAPPPGGSQCKTVCDFHVNITNRNSSLFIINDDSFRLLQTTWIRFLLFSAQWLFITKAASIQLHKK
jgi:hypothetical protein